MWQGVNTGIKDTVKQELLGQFSSTVEQKLYDQDLRL